MFVHVLLSFATVVACQVHVLLSFATVVACQDTSPPSFTIQPETSRGYDFKIMDKRIPLELSCEATGTPEPTYKWLKYDPNGDNKVELDPDDPRVTITDGRLVLGDPEIQMEGEAFQERVNEADQGLYQCVAENVFGSALSRKINATLAFLDSFKRVESYRVTAQVGEKVVLNCDPPSGVPPSYINIYWSWGNRGTAPRNPVELDDRVLQDNNGNLVFANIQTRDEYDFMCNVPNHFVGEVETSPIIEVVVQTNRPAPNRSPSWVYKPPITVEVLRTKILELKCIAEGNPTPQIQWGKEGGELPMERIKTGPNGATLAIRDITFEDDGTYVCECSNGEGASITYKSTVTVRSAPYWDPSPPADTTIAPKESVTITCQAGGSPASSVSWLVNGEEPSEIEDNPRVEINSGQGSGQIIVTRAQQSDTAVFQCITKNQYGEEIANIFLNVLAIPAEILKQPEYEYEIGEGSTLAMRCEPYGKPDPTVTWSFEGNVITPGGRHSIEDGGSEDGTLIITDVTVDDSGSYNCNVSNDFGSQDASPKVIVLTVPDPPINAIVAGSRGDANGLDATVEWTPGADGNTPITEYSVEYKTEYDDLGWMTGKTVSAASTQATLTLKADNTYNFRVKAKNKVGTSMASENSPDHTTPEKAPSMNPGNVKGLGSQPGLMVVSWDRMHPVDYAGPDFKYVVRYRPAGTDEWIEREVPPAKNEFMVEDKTVTFQEYEVQVITKNNNGPSAAQVETITGYSGESEPTAAPSNVSIEVIGSTTIKVNWVDVPADSINGQLLGYRAFFSIKQTASGSQRTEDCEKSPCVISNLQAYNSYELQLAARSGKGIGPKSDTIRFKTPEGEPSGVNELQLRASSERILATWKKPDAHNGVLRGYVLTYNKIIVVDLVVGDPETIHVEVEDNMRQIIDGLESENKYRITVQARTGGGAGKEEFTEINTRPEGKPREPGKPIFDEIGPTSMNISYKPDPMGPAADFIAVKYYKKKGGEASDAKESDTVDIFEKDAVHVTDLTPNTMYVFQIVAKNTYGERIGEWEEAKTPGIGTAGMTTTATTQAPDDFDLRLEILLNKTVTTENAESVAATLTDLVATETELGDQNLNNINKVLTNIVNVSSPSENVTRSVVKLADYIMNSYDADSGSDVSVPGAPNQIQRALESQISTFQTQSGNTTFDEDNLAIRAVKVPVESVSDGRLVFDWVSGDKGSQLGENSTKVSIGETPRSEAEVAISFPIPRDILDNFSSNESVPISFIVYQNDKLFPSIDKAKLYNDADEFRREVGGRIISATVETVEVIRLPPENPVALHFTIDKEQDEKIGNITCVFWDNQARNGLGDWSTKGCYQYNKQSESVICHCTHLTSFSVLVDRFQTRSYLLDIISKIGCGVSIICLGLTILTYLSRKKITSTKQQQIFISFCSSLASLYITFLVGIERTNPKWGCVVVSVLLHYFTLTTILWMAAEALNIYIYLVKVVGVHISKFMFKASVVAWGVPAVIVAVIAIVDAEQYRNTQHCFINIDYPFYFTQVLLLMLTIIFNAYIFIRAMYKITCGRKQSTRDKNKAEEMKKRAKNAFALSSLLGLTWVFGLLSLIHEDATLTFQILFCVFNSLQGLFVFIMFCVLKDDIRTIWRECCCKWFSNVPVDSSSGPAGKTEYSTVPNCNKSEATSQI